MHKRRAEVGVGRVRWVTLCSNSVCVYFVCIILIAGVWVVCRSVIEGVDLGLRVAEIARAILSCI